MNTDTSKRPDCLFCKIAAGEFPCFKIWEDEAHLAFLTPFPNTPGFSVVIPKAHHPSYAFQLPDAVFTGLVRAAREVGLKIDAAFDRVGRTGMIFEGFGVDHAHAKLFPMHGTASEGWAPIRSNVDKFFENYEGYMSTHDGPRAEDAWLEEIAAKIRAAQPAR
jgi:diadenosine tetraphosphate (Ap4A) HIT family hydrolase